MVGKLFDLWWIGLGTFLFLYCFREGRRVYNKKHKGKLDRIKLMVNALCVLTGGMLVFVVLSDSYEILKNAKSWLHFIFFVVSLACYYSFVYFAYSKAVESGDSDKIKSVKNTALKITLFFGLLIIISAICKYKLC